MSFDPLENEEEILKKLEEVCKGFNVEIKTKMYPARDRNKRLQIQAYMTAFNMRPMEIVEMPTIKKAGKGYKHRSRNLSRWDRK